MQFRRQWSAKARRLCLDLAPCLVRDLDLVPLNALSGAQGVARQSGIVEAACCPIAAPSFMTAS